MNWPRIILDGLSMSLTFDAVGDVSFSSGPMAWMLRYCDMELQTPKARAMTTVEPCAEKPWPAKVIWRSRSPW